MSAVALAAPFLARLTEAAYLVTPGPPMMAANEHIRGLVAANGSASLLRTKARVEDLQSAAQVPAAAGFAAALLVAALAISGSGLVKLRVRRASLGVALGVFLGVLPAFATHSLGSPTMLVPTLEIFSIGHHCCTFIELPALCVMMVVVVVSLGFAETLSSDVLRPKQQPFSDSVRAACQRVCMIQLPSVDGFLILRVVQAGMVACFLAAVAGAVGTGANSLGLAGALFVYWATMASVTAMFVVATLDQLSQTRRSSVSPASTASSTPGATVALATDLVAGGTLHAGASRARSRSAVSTARGTSISGEYTSSGQSEASTEFAAGEFCRPSCTPASATFFAQLVALAVGIVAPNVAIVIFLAHGHNGHGSCLTTFGNVAEIARRFDHWPHGCTSADCRESIIASLELTVYATWIASVVVASSCALAIMYGQATVAKERAEDARKAADHMHSALCYVSHEARSPLNGAALSLALLDGIIRGDGDPSEAPQLVGDLHASVEAAKRQLDDMLTFERVTSLRAARSVEWGWSRVAGSELRRLRSSFAGVCRAERVKLRFRGVSSRPACGGLGSSIIRESSFVSGQLSLLRHVKLGKVEGAVEPTNDDSAVTAADIRSGAESGSSAGNGSQLHTAAGRSGGPTIAGAGAGRSGVVAVSGRSSSKGVEMAGQPFFDSSQTGSSENVARTTSSGGSIDALNPSRRPTHGEPVADFEVFADIDRIMSVIGNALSNAIKYVTSSDGRGRVTVSLRKVLVIEVLDNGRGIAEERLSADTLFRPFQQLRMGDGMLSMAAGGLGLSTVRAIVVDQMGGDVSLASKLGVGTLFTARIPVWARRRIVGPEFDTSHAWSEDGTLSEAGSDVAWGLVRETTSMAATTWRSERGFASDRNVARALRAWGFAVAEMEDGRRAMDALQALVRSSAAPEAGTVGSPAAVPESAAASAAPLGGASRWPDAVLLDSRMPELDGEGVLRELRELAASLASSGEAAMAARVRAIPVLGATGSTDAVEQGSLLRGGALAILVKPIDPVELALALEREARVALPPQARERQGVE
ncbi:hypothetical protein FNF29_07241 [Cafeteria roenbergensis]|uniref:histidine kinase n=1 Tax=Cafeteria roenbergensis TaxID=33653 RepID=A0A5A8C4E9_CAFRO|nr:hypothetical protein FNF29_07241 [Cafeteria roenbergensis]|eukprot:KAA0147594.1 hypothetical protein FNF29_07241 [Cafeteria roenbergensis]